MAGGLGVKAGPFTYAAHALAAAAAIMVLIWCIHFRGGLAFEAANKNLIFNVHPVLMLIGYIILGSEGKDKGTPDRVFFRGTTIHMKNIDQLIPLKILSGSHNDLQDIPKLEPRHGQADPPDPPRDRYRPWSRRDLLRLQVPQRQRDRQPLQPALLARDRCHLSVRNSVDIWVHDVLLPRRGAEPEARGSAVARSVRALRLCSDAGDGGARVPGEADVPRELRPRQVRCGGAPGELHGHRRRAVRCCRGRCCRRARGSRRRTRGLCPDSGQSVVGTVTAKRETLCAIISTTRSDVRTESASGYECIR